LNGEGYVFHSTVIFELKDGKIWRDTRYFAEPFEAPGHPPTHFAVLGGSAEPTELP
jgi:hypothetical protein